MVRENVNNRPVYKVSFLFTKPTTMKSLLWKWLLMFLFQREEKTKDGDEVYLWYNSDDTAWNLSSGENFRARKGGCWIYIKTTGKQ